MQGPRAVRRAIPLAAAILIGAAGIGIASTGGPVPPPPAPRPGPAMSVIVRGDNSAAAAAAVRAAGGSVVSTLDAIDGVSATVPAVAVAALQQSTDVEAVTQDGALTSTSPAAVAAAPAPVDPVAVLPQDAAAAAQADPASTNGLTGAGVDVAVIDTGVSAVPGLDDPGQVIKAPDFSTDPSGSGIDGYGHGTAMASIIAGHETGDGTGYAGVAPGARILNVRVGNNDGTVDVSQIIAAISWVIQHAHDHGLNVRVINLAYGTDSTQAVNLDPLDFAADRAWQSGIVVVAAAGNAGNAAPVSDPASDPNLLAVGATDTHDSASTGDDTLAPFSSGDGGTRHPDLAAPGSRILSLRDPGSFLDTAFPAAVRNTYYFRGSGTSQASAVVSGAVALLLQARPSLTPDQVKALLTGAADTAPGSDVPVLDLSGALTAPVPATAPTRLLTGLGSLEGARGTNHVLYGGHLVSGGLTATGSAWSGSAWSGSAWSGSAWSGSAWSGSAWSGSAWSGSAWSGSAWSGSAWSGSAWSGSAWSGSAWSGSVWSGLVWE